MVFFPDATTLREERTAEERTAEESSAEESPAEEKTAELITAIWPKNRSYFFRSF